jgi:hypothetical protein
MTIEDRVRRVLAEAAADEPPLRGAPLEAALRRRRRRPVLAGAVALALVLAAVVAVAAVRSSGERPLPSTVSTKGWKLYTDVAGNLRFRYPPDWRLEVDEADRPGARLLILTPPGIAVSAAGEPGFKIEVRPGQRFWIGEDWFGPTSRGRLPNGRSYLRAIDDPTETGGWGRQPPPLDDRPRAASWSIDWGRPCLTGEARCAPHSVHFHLHAADGRLWERYRAVAETIPTTVEQLRPTAPTVGDRSLPACRPGQWRLVGTEEYAMRNTAQGMIVQGGVRYLRGARCHLRLTLRLAVEGEGGRPLPVRGNPATTTVEGDLPVDAIKREGGSWNTDGALIWRFVWDEWCNRGLPQATLRVTADGGASLTVPGMSPAAEQAFSQLQGPGPAPCHDRGRPSTVAGWPQ